MHLNLNLFLFLPFNKISFHDLFDFYCLKKQVYFNVYVYGVNPVNGHVHVQILHVYARVNALQRFHSHDGGCDARHYDYAYAHGIHSHAYDYVYDLLILQNRCQLA